MAEENQNIKEDNNWLDEMKPTEKEILRANNQNQNEKRHFSRQVAETTVVLRSNQAQKIYRRFFRHVNNALMSISVGMQIDPSTQEETQKIIDNVVTMISKVKDSLEVAISSITQRMLKEGIQFNEFHRPYILGLDIKDDKPQVFHIELRSPTSLKFLQLLGLLDKYCNLESFLWFAGNCSNAENSNVRFKWQQTVGKVGIGILSLEETLRKNVKKSTELQAATEINYEELDNGVAEAKKEHLVDENNLKKIEDTKTEPIF